VLRLSRRLKRVAALVHPVDRVLDIGSDHAYLPCFLVLDGKCRRAIAGEVRRGPFETARRNVMKLGLADRVEVRLGDGLCVIRPGEVQGVVIAGLGGGAIFRILERGRDTIRQGVEQLIIQPMNQGGSVREWLQANGWRVTEEDLVDEGLIYELIRAVPSSNVPESTRGRTHPAIVEQLRRTREGNEILLDLGEILLTRRHPLLLARVEGERRSLERMFHSLQRAQSSAAQARRDVVQRKLAILSEVVVWLSQSDTSSVH
jgi:tRNA (adenine22-N1)-methyltransferase